MGPGLLAAWALQGGWQACLVAPLGCTLGLLSRTPFSGPLALSLACWALQLRWWLAWPCAGGLLLLYAYLFLLGLATFLPSAHRGVSTGASLCWPCPCCCSKATAASWPGQLPGQRSPRYVLGMELPEVLRVSPGPAAAVRPPASS